MDLAGLVSDWYPDHARDLPWRRAGTDPWAILVSEVMLQQTPVARVEPVWRAWLTRWPNASDLASATAGDAVRMWGKLGYPRRALRLHQCATALRDRHGGEVPADVEALLGLPGIGEYTARAVATFAFGQRHPVVDVNVRRVVARAVLGRAEPGPPSTQRDLREVEALLPVRPAAAALTSIALMELGALVCRPAAQCPACPVRARCAWRAAGYPAHSRTKAPSQRFAGTDRQVRGRLLDVLRSDCGPVPADRLGLAWPEPEQRARALTTLVADGLVERLADDRFALPGHDRADEIRRR